MKCFGVLAAAVMALMVGVAQADEFVLVDRSGPESQVAVIEQPPEAYREALGEFVARIKLVTGVEMPVLEAGEVGSRPVLRFDIRQDPSPATNDTFSFTFPGADEMRVVCTQVSFQWALNRLLEDHAGVHVVMPEEVGLSYRERDRVAIPRQEASYSPSFPLHRTIYFASDTWQKDQGFVSKLRFNHDFYQIIYPHSRYLREGYPPAIMPVHQGKRLTAIPRNDRPAQYWQPCYSSPESVRIAVENITAYLEANPDAVSISLTINDNGGFCQCDQCLAANGGKRKRSQSEVYFKWVNAVASQVARKHPDIIMPALAYAEVIDPPSFDIHPNVPILITLDLYSVTDPAIKAKHKKLIADWAGKAGTLGVWDYAWGYSYIPPRMYLKEQVEMMRYLHRQGARIYFLEYECMDSKEGPKPYLYARMLWDVDLDARQVVDQWYELAVGPEAAPYLKQYYEKWEAYFSGAEIRKTAWFGSAKYVYMTWGDPSHVYALQPGDLAEYRKLMEQVVAHARRPQDKARAQVLMRRFELVESLLVLRGAEVIPTRGTVDQPAQAVGLLQNVNGSLPYLRQFEAVSKAMRQEEAMGAMLYGRMPGNYLKADGNALLLEQLSLASSFIDQPQVRREMTAIHQNEGLSPLLRAAAGHFVAPDRPSQDMLADEDFEQPESADVFKPHPQYDLPGRGERSTDFASSGRYAYKLLPGRLSKLSFQPQAEPGAYYLATFRVYVPQADSEAYMSLAFYPARNGLEQSWRNTPKINVAAGKWHTFSVAVSTRTDSDQVSLNIDFGNFAPDQAVYVDDLRVVKLGSAPPAISIDLADPPAIGPVPAGYRQLPLQLTPNLGLAKDLLLEPVKYQDGQGTLRLTGSRQEALSHFFYNGGRIPATSQSRVHLELWVRGEGNLVYGVYTRDDKDVFINTEARREPLRGQWQKITAVIPLKQLEGRPPVSFIRPVVGFAGRGGVAEVAAIRYRVE